MSDKIPAPSKRLDGTIGHVWQWTLKVAKASPVTPLVDLGAGLMEHNPPDYVCEAYKNSLSRVDVNQYSPNDGFPELAKTLADVYSPFYKRRLNPATEISIHTGGNQALLSCMMAFIDEGDEVVLIEPAFSAYELQIRFVGGTPVYVPLRAPAAAPNSVDSNEWRLDLDEFRSVFTSRTKAVILNTPHNPLGKIFTEEELLAIGNICVEHGVIIVSDEVYERTNYSKEPISRIATISQEIGKRTLTVGSSGKVFNATGWRLGWLIGDERLIPYVKAAHFTLSYVPPGPPQIATIVGFEKADEMGYWESNKLEMQKRMNILCGILDELGLKYSQPHAAYFLLVFTDALEIPADVSFPDDIKAASRDRKVCWWLIQKFGIVTIPGSAFYCEQHAQLSSNLLRLVACKSAAGLESARERLLQLKPFVRRD